MSPGITIACCLLGLSAASGQSLVVDRGLPSGEPSTASTLRAGWDQPGHGFVADTFRIGATGEIWMIDHIRIWGVSDSARALGDLFSNIAIYGGIQMDLTEVAQCACHRLAKLKAATLQRGSNAASPGVDVADVNSDGSTHIWQVDFRDLRWSAPGGSNLQFGVMATGRPAPDGHTPIWFSRGKPAGHDHSLESIDKEGRPIGRTELPAPMELYVQVWAHPSENAGKQ